MKLTSVLLLATLAIWVPGRVRNEKKDEEDKRDSDKLHSEFPGTGAWRHGLHLGACIFSSCL